MIIILFAPSNCEFHITKHLLASDINNKMQKRTIGISLITFHPKNSSRLVLEYCALSMEKEKKTILFYQQSEFISAWTSANAHTLAHQVFESRERKKNTV